MALAEMTQILRIKGKRVELTTKQLWSLYWDIRGALDPEPIQPTITGNPIHDGSAMEIPMSVHFMKMMTGCGNCGQNGLN